MNFGIILPYHSKEQEEDLVERVFCFYGTIIMKPSSAKKEVRFCKDPEQIIPNRRRTLSLSIIPSPTSSKSLSTNDVSTTSAATGKYSSIASRATTSNTNSTREDTTSYSVLSSYIEQSRSVLDSQRALFAQERQLWEREREFLKSRIAKLEHSLLLLSGGGNSNNNAGGGEDGGEERILTKDSSNGNGNNNSVPWKTWNKPTRVFSPSNINDDNEKDDTPPSLDAALSLSPRSGPTIDHQLPPSIPVGILDSNLDGINLKSSALPPDVAARVINTASSSSTSPSSGEPSGPSQQQQQEEEAPPKRRQSMNTRNLKLDLGSSTATATTTTTTTATKNLVMDAGHTPMAIINEGGRDIIEDEEEDEDDDDDGHYPAQPPSTRRPTESSVTYFQNRPSETTTDGDVALKGPLSLLNDKDHDSDFLLRLDEKLNQAHAAEEEVVEEEQEEEDDAAAIQHESVPEIRFKKNTTNFGIAFGEIS